MTAEDIAKSPLNSLPLNSIKRWHATLAADGKLIAQQERPCWLGVTPRQQRPARQCVVRCLNR